MGTLKMNLINKISFFIQLDKLVKPLNSITMKNWKPKLFGVLAGASTMGANYFPQFAPLLIPLSAFFVACVGWVSKSASVTGGTVPQTDEAKSRLTK